LPNQQPIVAGNWDTFNKLAKEVLHYKPMAKEELHAIFIESERLIRTGVGYLLHTTTFIDDNLCYLLSEIAAGIIKSRKVYRGKRIRMRVSVGDDSVIEMGSENRRILGIGFDLYKLSRMDRASTIPFISRIIRTLHVSTSSYEVMLTAFLKESQQYCEISDSLADLMLQLNRMKHYGEPLTDQHEVILKSVGNYMDDLASMEVSVGCIESNYMYGCIKAISSIMRKLRLLQEKILRAYLRLVLKPVREKAHSEMEAFDLFQAGSMGLSKAISLYDVWSGTSFPTFANSWIRQKIFGSAKRSGPMVKLPGSVWEMHQKIRAVERQLESDPTLKGYTLQDVSDRMGISVKSIDRVLRKFQSTKVVLLDSLVRKNGEGHEEEAVSDKVLVDDASVLLLSRSQQSSLERILKKVDTDQRNVVCLRYGMIDAVDNTRIEKKQILREIFRQTAGRAFDAKQLL